MDEASIMSIVGFDCGGPVTLCTVGCGREDFVTYVTCELSVRDEQPPAVFGRYEIMMTCDNEDWARKILTKIGQMSMESVFQHGHTVDISQIVGRRCPIRGLVVEEFARLLVNGDGYGILRLHGVTSPELKFAMQFGVDPLLQRLKAAQIYPRTSIYRKHSVVTTG